MGGRLILFLKYCFAVLAVIAAATLIFLFVGWPSESADIDYGVTFSRPYAALELKIDADDLLKKTLDDLGIRNFRLAAYWKFVQPNQYEWNFKDLDKDISAIGDRQGRVLLAIGEKLPHWPECWGPDWWKQLPRDEQRVQTLRYIETVVRRYRDNPTIEAWQIENEPHFSYGDCPKTDPDFLVSEIALVKGLDPTRPVVTTDSGELSTWMDFGKNVDALGVSVYRVVKNPYFGIWRYWFVPPFSYQRKALLTSLFGIKKVFISEFQMEPWSNEPLPQTPLDEQFKTFDVEQMRANFDFAKRARLSPVYFWGLEWWYWMKENQGHPEFWDEARGF
ncbi:hypothetical protein KKC31_01540, partial [Patescibacteria group bacterium]|nr:hypothetical protein [Patescibacteria group bacterium]